MEQCEEVTFDPEFNGGGSQLQSLLYDYDRREVMAARLFILANMEPSHTPGQCAYLGLNQPKCLWQAGNLQSWEMLSLNTSEHRR